MSVIRFSHIFFRFSGIYFFRLFIFCFRRASSGRQFKWNHELRKETFNSELFYYNYKDSHRINERMQINSNIESNDCICCFFVVCCFFLHLMQPALGSCEFFHSFVCLKTFPQSRRMCFCVGKCSIGNDISKVTRRLVLFSAKKGRTHTWHRHI